MNARFQPARQEDLRLITGQGRFTADVHYEGELHLHVIRSMHAHGRITRMELDAVRSAPGVVAVYTARDIPGENNCGPILHDDPFLADGKVEFVGQAVAVVVAREMLYAREAAAAAVVSVDALSLPHAASPSTATRPTARPLKVCFLIVFSLSRV